MKKVDIDYASEKKRKEIHLEAYQTWLGKWHRRNNMLYEDFGRLLYREIIDVVQAGPKESPNGVGLKQAHIINCLDTSFHLMKRIVDQKAMIHRKPFALKGDIANDPNWVKLRLDSGIDCDLQHKLELSIALDCCGVRAYYEEGFGPGLAVVPPHLITVLVSPTNPLIPVAVIEKSCTGKGVTVWDIIGPEAQYSSWKNLTDWVDYKNDKRSVSPIFMLAGEDFPWYWNNEAILPWEFYQDSAAPEEILPASRSKMRDTIDLILDRSYLRWAGKVGMFNKPLIISEGDQPLDGIYQSMNEASNLVNLFGAASSQLSIIPDSSNAIEKAWDRITAQTQETLNRYDTAIQVKKSESAKSGVAIQLELSGLYQQRMQQEQQNRGKDQNLIRILIATYNYLVRCGEIPTEEIAEKDFEISYPIAWTADEKSRLVQEIKDQIVKGIKTPVDLYIIENDLPDDEIHRQKAMEVLRSRAAERKELIEAGLLLTPADLMKIKTSTYEDLN